MSHVPKSMPHGLEFTPCTNSPSLRKLGKYDHNKKKKKKNYLNFTLDVVQHIYPKYSDRQT